MRKALAIVVAVLLTAALGMSVLAYTNGVFEGEAEGYLGKIKLAVTVEGGAVKAIKVLERHDTDGIFDMA